MIKELNFRKRSTVTATPETIAAFERTFGLRLPATLAEFCSRWNGGFPSADNKFYPVPRTFEEFFEAYGPKSTGVITDGLYGLTRELEPCDLEREFLLQGEVSSIALIPVSFDLLGNTVVLRTDASEGPVFWRDHELWEAPERPHLIPIAESLEFFYNSLTMASAG